MIWLDVVEVFAKNHSNIVPVLDDDNTYLGYYELEDIIKFFHETPFLREQGGIIVVEKIYCKKHIFEKSQYLN